MVLWLFLFLSVCFWQRTGEQGALRKVILSLFVLTRPPNRIQGSHKRRKTILVFKSAILIHWPLVFSTVYVKSSGSKWRILSKYPFYERNTNFYTWNITLWSINVCIRQGLSTSWHITPHVCIKRDFSQYSWTTFSALNRFCLPHNVQKQQGCRKRQKVGRNQLPCCSNIFPHCFCVLWRWMWPSSVWPASELPAAGYTALHSLASD